MPVWASTTARAASGLMRSGTACQARAASARSQIQVGPVVVVGSVFTPRHEHVRPHELARPTTRSHPHLTAVQFFGGKFAVAGWLTVSPQRFTITSVAVNLDPAHGFTQLVVEQSVGTRDPITGLSVSGTTTQVVVSSGFTFTIDSARFSRAALHATDVPRAQLCLLLRALS
jgi:hypothetical protein